MPGTAPQKEWSGPKHQQCHGEGHGSPRHGALPERILTWEEEGRKKDGSVRNVNVYIPARVR